MISHPEARALAGRLAEAACSDDPEAWSTGRAALQGLDGAGWLVLDQAARRFRLTEDAPVSGTRRWRRA
ncbi:hypothetical protein, partial [Cellulomonas bogoriensis]|uniref:hypothetical protein n=1 Tax=Cellulomonas bogoriensis TaxID=301388 RepID=UPI0005505A8A